MWILFRFDQVLPQFTTKRKEKFQWRQSFPNTMTTNSAWSATIKLGSWSPYFTAYNLHFISINMLFNKKVCIPQYFSSQMGKTWCRTLVSGLETQVDHNIVAWSSQWLANRNTQCIITKAFLFCYSAKKIPRIACNKWCRMPDRMIPPLLPPCAVLGVPSPCVMYHSIPKPKQ